jgi:flagella basal body P-ring formation protein FlgA
MKRVRISWLGLGVLLLLIAEANAESRAVRIVGRKNVTVTTPAITVADIAEVTSQTPGNDEALIALKRIKVAAAPKPGQTSTIAANAVLDTLRNNGVDLQVVGYKLPRVIAVERAGRPLLENELRAVIESVLATTGRDITLRDVSFDEKLSVVPGDVEMAATLFETQRPGKLGFSFEVTSKDSEVQHFDVMATIDEWRQIPVATRSIARGATVEVNDFKMARFNISQLPDDVALEPESIYGLAADRNISFGDIFRRAHLSIPPVIEMGASVTLLYRKGALEASASGVAIESGAIGDEIRVRNESSKRIIMGEILEPGIVGVGQ